MSRLKSGIKEVEIGGEEYTLKVTISAIEAIERRFGNFQKAAQQCMALGWTDALFIISKAAGLNKAETEKLKEHALDEGLESLATMAAQFLGMVVDPSSSDSESDDEGED